MVLRYRKGEEGETEDTQKYSDLQRSWERDGAATEKREGMNTRSSIGVGQSDGVGAKTEEEEEDAERHA